MLNEPFGAVPFAGLGGEQVPLAGTADGSSTVSGVLDAGQALVGTSNGSSTVTASLDAQQNFVGTSDGVSTVEGSLDAGTGLVGTSDGTSTVTGALGVAWSLAGESDGAATVTGNAQVQWSLAATSDGVGGANGALNVSWSLAGTSDGVGDASAVLDAQQSLVGTSDGTSTVSGSAQVAWSLIGTSDGVATATAALDAQQGLVGTSDGTSTVTGQLAEQLAGTSAGSSIVTGSLDTGQGLVGNSAGTSTVNGIAQLSWGLAGTSDGTSTATCTLDPGTEWDDMRMKLVTAPTVEPVSLAEAKSHLHKYDTSEDSYIETLITAAREYVEFYTGRALITQTWKMALDKFPVNQSPQTNPGISIQRASQIEIPRAPLQSITHIKYYDTSGSLQTLDSDTYDVDDYSHPGRVYPAYAQIWPDARLIENAIEVQFVAGYGDAATDVPGTLKHAIKLLISHWFELRNPVAIGTTTKEIQFALESLLWSERITTVAQ